MNLNKNLVFLGMMGSGKTSIGSMISKKLKLEFFDIDHEIEKKTKDFVSSGIEWMPINKIKLDKEKSKSVINFLEALENDDDVQHVYANLEVANNFLEKN